MIERLLRLSLQHRGVVLVAALVVLALGVQRASELPVDVFPDLTAPRTTVVTEATGLAAEEIERLVTYPIEAAVHGTTGVRRVRSASAPGISVVWIEFDWDTPQNLARQRVTERLQQLGGALPAEASAPSLAPDASVMGEIAFVALTSDRAAPMELRRIGEAEVRRRLLAVEGVAQVVAIGGDERQIHVLADPERLQRAGLTLTDLVEAVRRGSRSAPGGFLVERGQESVIRVLGRAGAFDELEQIVIGVQEGQPVRVRDVADVAVGAAPARGAASYKAQPAVMLSVVKQPRADTRSTTSRVEKALDELGAGLAARGVAVHRDVFRQQDFIDTAISNVLTVLRDGAILVVLVLLVFLWSLRPTLISAIAIPLSLVVTALALDLLGLRIDTMTLGGLAIAIGELVDDAIVDVDNVVRRLRDRAALPEGERASVRSTVLEASREIRSSIVSATYIIVLVFAPLLLLEGLEGRLLRPLAIAYTVAILASLVVAVTVTPVLCSLLLPSGVARADGREPPVLRWIGRGYAPALSAALRHPSRVAVAAFALVLAGGAGFLGLGRAFLPEFNEGSLTINMVLEPGTALAESDALAAMAERALLADPGVVAVGRRTGRAERDEHVLGVETSELEVRLRADDPRTKEALLADVRERLRVVPGAFFTIGQPISHRIEHMISGQRAALSIKVFGPDLGSIRRVAADVERVARTVPALADVGAEPVVEVPQVTVQIDPHGAATYGWSPGVAAAEIATALWGEVAGHIVEEGAATEIVVKAAARPEDLDALGRVGIPTRSGAVAPVAALAEVRRDLGPNVVLRENLERRVVVTANVAGGDLRAAYEETRRRIDAGVSTPEGVRIELAGQFEREAAAGRRLLVLGFLVVLAIAAIVAMTLGSVRRAVIVLANLPLALVGGVLGVYFAGGVLSVATTIGFITLFGIATRNGILLATRTGELERQGVAWRAAVESAARERLAPILMTAVTAALGLLPLALALGRPGSEIQAPMALVILCGLTTSTLLNMVVVPALLLRWGAGRELQLQRPDAPSSPLVAAAERVIPPPGGPPP